MKRSKMIFLLLSLILTANLFCINIKAAEGYEYTDSLALAEKLNAGFVMARKPGKLPAETIEETYTKEYGVDSIQVHKDAIDENDIVLLHDDLLATGGTMAAAHRLVKKCGAKQTYINFVIELEELNGRKAFPENVEITSLLVK